MWELPLTALIAMGLLLYGKRMDIEAQRFNNKYEDNIVLVDRLDSLEEEFKDYKKRVDTLTLKAGFKL